MSRDKKNENSRFIVGIIISTFFFGICFWLSYLLTNFIYHYTGAPAKAWTYVITGIMGLYIFAAGIKIIIDIQGKKHLRKGRDHMMGDVLDAMKQIAQGDFSVVMKVEKHDPFSELAETINKMAHELGTLENLRQDFITNVSHEIQSPLTSISGFTELLSKDSVTAEERAHYIDIIAAESKRLSKLSDNLLKLSSLDANATPLSFSKFRLDKQIQSSLLLLEPLWSEKNLDISLVPEAVFMFGDEHLMAQVWINLLHNSIKFTPKDGTITIKVLSENSKIVIRIADSGIGISEEDKLHIFERFYKVDKARDRNLGGNGLGLSLVKKIVELHKGTIEVESQIGIGTTFTIKFPK
jgi:signal transduction histidine kinase